MADTKISALPDIGTPTDLDELAVNDGGTSKRMTLNALVAYIESRARQVNTSVAAQTLGTADTYLTGSSITIPAGRLQAKSAYRCRFYAQKTAAGTAVPVFNFRFGTAGTTADTSRGTLTLPAAQTAALDEGLFEVAAVFRVVGASAVVIASGGLLAKRAALTAGFSAAHSTGTAVGTASAAFNSTVANSIIGVSVNAGASSAWTVQQVVAELFNLA